MIIKLAIASDHAGYPLKEFLKKEFDSVPVNWIDLGPESIDSVDYPDYAYKVAECIKQKKADFGVVICGTGIGISIAANRYPEVRAALCMNSTMARLTRQHNDANVLALGARLIGEEIALDCLKVFLETSFEQGRHQKRVDKLSVCTC